MEILINEKRIDFTLEKEIELGDVISSLEEFAFTNGNVIEAITVDDRPVVFDYGSEEFRKNVDAVKELKIVTYTRTELAIRTLVTMDEFIGLLIDRCGRFHGHTEDDTLIEGLKLSCEGISDALRVLEIKEIAVRDGGAGALSDFLSHVREFISFYERRYLDDEAVHRMQGFLAGLEGFLPKILKWIRIKHSSLFTAQEGEALSPFLREIAEDLSVLCLSSIERCETMSEHFQIGEDSIALEDLNYLIELFEEILIVLRTIKGATKRPSAPLQETVRALEGLLGKITHHLKAVETALSNGDMITLGDIFEYEIKPLFEPFPALFSSMGKYLLG